MSSHGRVADELKQCKSICDYPSSFQRSRMQQHYYDDSRRLRTDTKHLTPRSRWVR